MLPLTARGMRRRSAPVRTLWVPYDVHSFILKQANRFVEHLLNTGLPRVWWAPDELNFFRATLEVSAERRRKGSKRRGSATLSAAVDARASKRRAPTFSC